MSSFHKKHHSVGTMSNLYHTGLTPQVLDFKPPDSSTKEFVPPPDRAFSADRNKISLLSAASKVTQLTPYIGTELSGVQLSRLTEKQKDELALLAAEVGPPAFFGGQTT